MTTRLSFGQIAQRATAAIDPHYESFCAFVAELDGFAKAVNSLCPFPDQEDIPQDTPRLRIFMQTKPVGLQIQLYYYETGIGLIRDRPAYSLQNGSLQLVKDERAGAFENVPSLDIHDPDGAKVLCLQTLLSVVSPAECLTIVNGLRRLDEAAPTQVAQRQVPAPSAQ